jgi:hypothetical protein
MATLWLASMVTAAIKSHLLLPGFQDPYKSVLLQQDAEVAMGLGDRWVLQ